MRNVAEDFHTQVRPRVEQLLASGESLEGVCAATQQSTFRGGMVALAVTDRRLLVQPLDRHAQPKGDAVSIPPAELATFDAGGLGGGDAQQAGIAALGTWVRQHHPGG